MVYDVAVIGAGWAGFNAARKARQLGLKACLIEKNAIGGTCLNRGCIPAKSFLYSAKLFTLSQKAASFGINTAAHQINLTELINRKNKVIAVLAQSMQSLLGGIDYINGNATFLNDHALDVSGRKIEAKNFIIAVGSHPAELKILPFDAKRVLSSDHLLNINALPRSILIVGGGVIGCEFATFFSSFSVEVTIVEKMPELLSGEDPEISRKIEALFRKRGIKAQTNCDVSTIDTSKFDMVLVCVGRAPSLDGLGLENLKLKIVNKALAVDDYLRTSLPNIYACGDCASRIMLAHYAAYQGEICALNIASKNSELKKAETSNIPNSIFTEPEIASIGLNEPAAKAAGFETKVYKLDFLASGMARIIDETDGFIKITVDAKTDTIIGGSIIGPKACEIIAVIDVAVKTRLKISQLREVMIAHPTLAESLVEAVKQ